MARFNYRLALFTAFALFLAWHTPWALNQVTQNPDYYTSWDFHECYVKTLNASYCTATVVRVEMPGTTRGYEYYPPLTHLIAKALPLPPLQALQFMAVAIFLGLITLMSVGTNNFFAGLAFFFVAPQLWGTFLRGGTIPFFFLLFFLLIAVFWWHKLGWKAKTLLCVLAMATHGVGGWFFMGVAFFLEVLPRRTALAFSLFSSVLIAIVLDVNFDSQEYRGLIIVALFACVFLGEALAKLETEIALRQALA